MPLPAEGPHDAPPRRVAVVGAGLAGLAAARHFSATGCEVVVVDKGFRPGGRLSTRGLGDASFDFGAQFFTARDPGMQRHTGAWLRHGVIAEWNGPFVRLNADGHASPAKESVRYVACPGMVSLAQHIARDLDVRSGVRVVALTRRDKTWCLHTADDAELAGFDIVLLAMPAPQAAALLVPLPELAARARGVIMQPCWALLVEFATPVPTAYDAAFVTDHDISWMARDSSKPGRPAGERWVVHAGPAWSAAHLEETPEEIAPRLLQRFQTLTRTDVAAVTQSAHRWRYAQPVPDAPQGEIIDAGRGVGACGDWCRGGRVEGAWLSGEAAAAALLHA